MTDIILLTIDSLRFDAVFSNDTIHASLPTFQSLADDGLVFTDAYANAPYTSDSFLSILGGTHQWQYGEGHPTGFEAERPHLTEDLAGAGYRTAAFHSNPYLGSNFGFDRGFDYYPGREPNEDISWTDDPLAKARVATMERFRRVSPAFRAIEWTYQAAGRYLGVDFGLPYTPAGEITDQVVEWVHHTDDRDDRFVWAHYMDIHNPFYPHDGTVSANISPRCAIRTYHKALRSPDKLTDTEQGLLRRLYDGEIEFFDRHLADLFRRLDRHLSLEDTYFLLASDHGEAFGEHGFMFHPGEVYQELVHVPLMISGPDIENETIGYPVSNIDLVPTVLELAGVDVPGEYTGRQIHYPQALPSNRTVFAEVWDVDEGRIMAFDGRWKLIEDHSSGEEYLFDVETDHREYRNVLDEQSSVHHRLRDAIDAHLASIKDDQSRVERREIEASEAVKARLRRLGYDE
jgi:arylsulfatase A-like enzyme